MANQTENWTYAEFHAFTMLYAANADGKITMEERNLITPTLPEQDFEHIRTVFQSLDDAQALEVILSYREKYCRTPAEKDKILADMLAIYQADASFDQIERGVHQLFKRLM